MEDKSEAYVYLIRCNQFYKIGISRNVLARISTIQTGNPYTIELILCVFAPQALKFEQAFHAHFAHARVRGEWFELSADDLKEAIRGLVKVEDMVRTSTYA